MLGKCPIIPTWKAKTMENIQRQKGNHSKKTRRRRLADVICPLGNEDSFFYCWQGSKVSSEWCRLWTQWFQIQVTQAQTLWKEGTQCFTHLPVFVLAFEPEFVVKNFDPPKMLFREKAVNIPVLVQQSVRRKQFFIFTWSANSSQSDKKPWRCDCCTNIHAGVAKRRGEGTQKTILTCGIWSPGCRMHRLDVAGKNPFICSWRGESPRH